MLSGICRSAPLCASMNMTWINLHLTELHIMNNLLQKIDNF